MARRILIVEDDQRIVEIYRRALERTGYEVSCAYNGKEGLESLRKIPADLVILDLKMPKMSGDEFLKILRATPELKETKVLVMSSYLYKYREIPGKTVERIRVSIQTKMSRRAEKFGQAEGKFKMEEKKKPILTYTLFGPIEESEPKFKRRISLALVERVKEILVGEGGTRS